MSQQQPFNLCMKRSKVLLTAFLSGKVAVGFVSPRQSASRLAVGLWHVSSVAPRTDRAAANCLNWLSGSDSTAEAPLCKTPPTGLLKKTFANTIRSDYFITWWPLVFTSIVFTEQLLGLDAETTRGTDGTVEALATSHTEWCANLTLRIEKIKL